MHRFYTTSNNMATPSREILLELHGIDRSGIIVVIPDTITKEELDSYTTSLDYRNMTIIKYSLFMEGLKGIINKVSPTHIIFDKFSEKEFAYYRYEDILKSHFKGVISTFIIPEDEVTIPFQNPNELFLELPPKPGEVIIVEDNNA